MELLILHARINTTDISDANNVTQVLRQVLQSETTTTLTTILDVPVVRDHHGLNSVHFLQPLSLLLRACI